MDTNTATVLVVALLALVAIGFIVIFRRHTKMRFRGPFKTRLEMEGSNEPSAPRPGVQAEDVTSETGGLTADDETGRGVAVKKARAQKDIKLTAKSPPGQQAPKD